MIEVDTTIFRNPQKQIQGFSPIPYLINVNHPIINQLYQKYKKINHFPSQYPISDKSRIKFEDSIFRMIEAKKIIVKGMSINKILCLSASRKY